LGDGGNYEGTYVPWREPQPQWSVFRESSFGVGRLQIMNATHAHFSWNRSACEGSQDPTHINFNRSCESILWDAPTQPHDNSRFASVESDSTWIVRRRASGAECPNPSVQRLKPSEACTVIEAPPAPTNPPSESKPPPATEELRFGIHALIAAGVSGILL
ncbi:MAG: hypothetical protein SGPRY_007789, partial [Prymnesium sp.]